MANRNSVKPFSNLLPSNSTAIEGQIIIPRILSTSDHSPVLTPTDRSFTSPTELEILKRLDRLEENVTKFQHTVEQSLQAITNDLSKLQTRVDALERYHPISTGQTSTERQSNENLVFFNHWGKIGDLAGCVLSISTFLAEWLFIGIDKGTLEVWNVGNPYEYSRLQLLVLADEIAAFVTSSFQPSVSATALIVVTRSCHQQQAHLFAGLTNGHLAMFAIQSNKQSASSEPLKLCQIWPKISSPSPSAPVHCMTASCDKTMLAIARNNELIILPINNEGVQTDEKIFSYSFLITDVQHDQNKVHALMFDDDSQLLFCAVGYRCISVFVKQSQETQPVTWHLKARSLTIPLEMDAISITSMCMAAGNQLILAGASNGKLYVFEREPEKHHRHAGLPATASNNYKFTQALIGHFAAINCVHTIGTTYPLCVLTASVDTAIFVWHMLANDPEMISIVQKLDNGHEDSATCITIASNTSNCDCLPAAETVAFWMFSASLDKSVRVWTPSTKPARISISGSSYTSTDDEEEQVNDDEFEEDDDY